MAKTTKCKTPMVELRVLLSERDLYNLVNGRCTKEIETILEALKEIIDDPETKERVKDDGSLLVNLHTAILPIIKVIEAQWRGVLRNYANDTKLPPKKPLLTSEEKLRITRLRHKGLSIKAIGKTIHRAEKVVADFVRANLTHK